MYPSMSMLDYMTEMNRLFPGYIENELGISPQTSSNSFVSSPTSTGFGSPSNTGFLSPFSRTNINRSSSSADSSSPESYPDLSLPQTSHTDTPFHGRRQRPIVGRKIFDTPPTSDPKRTPIWQESQPLATTPPNINQNEQQNTQNLFNELYSTQRKEYEFRTPLKASQTYTPVSSANFVPNTQKFSPNSLRFTPRLPPPFQPRPKFNLSRQENNNMCSFCRKNGETPLVYTTHMVRAIIGGKTVVTCPILRSHVCMTCGATGDDAHTITYCPVLRSVNNGRPLQSTTITLKNTRIKSNGRRRY